jgi:hypothetical protein
MSLSAAQTSPIAFGKLSENHHLLTAYFGNLPNIYSYICCGAEASEKAVMQK